MKLAQPLAAGRQHFQHYAILNRNVTQIELSLRIAGWLAPNVEFGHPSKMLPERGGSFAQAAVHYGSS